MSGSAILSAANHNDCRSSVPVARAEDDARAGSGEIWISDDDPCHVFGENTKFLSELPPKCRIQLPKSTGPAAAEISEVISDTELKLKKPFGKEGGKATQKVREKIDEARASGKHGLEFRVLPYVDQQGMYGHVYRALKRGGCVGIFPEGEHS